VAFFIAFLGLVALFLHVITPDAKKASLLLAVFSLLVAIVATCFAAKQHHRLTERRDAIVMTPSVIVRGAPDDGGSELYVVHEGLKVTVIDSLGQWYSVRVADGNVGWVRQTDVERI
jgi:SH3-like domain-containing protein